MPFYMTQCSYTAEAWKALVAKPEDRAAATGKMIEAAGGKMLHFFFAFGEYDAVIISEAPDNTTYSSVALAAAAGGVLSKITTTVLMTPEEVIEALRGAGEVVYTPPGS